MDMNHNRSHEAPIDKHHLLHTISFPVSREQDTDWRKGSYPRIFLDASRLAGRRLLGRTGSTDSLLGQRLAEELDQLKGMGMKVGQILSYFDGVLPEETHTALRALQQGTHPMGIDLVRAQVEKALGAPLEVLYEEFNAKPVASPSIGQVHRARYNDHDVAVKVQYPGIEKTIDTDFRRLARIARLASMATMVDPAAIVAELRERFEEECDYRQEASNQEWFRAAFDKDPEIHIPQVVPERSVRTVLTMQWADGMDLYTLQETDDPERKSQVGLVLARFAFTCLYRLGRINSDPHPGNYLFRDQGPTTFLDFGSVRRFDPAFLSAYKDLVQTVLDDDRQAFPRALKATDMVGRERGFDYDRHWDLLCHEHAPYRDTHFTFTRQYLLKSLEYSRPSNPNLRKLAIPPQWIWIQRLQWGLHAVLARLGASGNFQKTLQQAISAS
jgi:predicted unusual protein kinase regulating ubiquinone biosynthesis (AarF/ABC1/UbiB family)